ncbi:MAG: phytoene/squalene synthase family protein [Chloroflexota bacterium]
MQAPVSAVIERHARTFAFAAQYLGARERQATATLYAYFRTLDDLVDESRNPEGAASALADWDGWLEDPGRAAGSDPLRTALMQTINEFAVPTRYLRALIVGLRSDLTGERVRTVDDLDRYCLRVAGSVGMAMCHVFGATSSSALGAAAAMGIAMQITNILRDIAEDLGRDRLYLPADHLAAEPEAARGLDQRYANPSLARLLRSHAGRARGYYRAGAAGLAELPETARYPLGLSAWLYEGILDELALAQFNPFAGRAIVPDDAKRAIAARLRATMQAHPLVWPPPDSRWDDGTLPATPTRAQLDEIQAWTRLERCPSNGKTANGRAE